MGLLQDTHAGQEQPKQVDTNMPDSPAGLRDKQLVLRQEGRAGMPNQHQAKGRMSQRGREARPERPLRAHMCSHAGDELSIVLRLCGPTEVLSMEGTSAAQWCIESHQVGTSLGLPDFHKKISAAIPYH